jgi:hypothetical protein
MTLPLTRGLSSPCTERVGCLGSPKLGLNEYDGLCLHRSNLPLNVAAETSRWTPYASKQLAMAHTDLSFVGNVAVQPPCYTLAVG